MASVMAAWRGIDHLTLLDAGPPLAQFFGGLPLMAAQFGDQRDHAGVDAGPPAGPRSFPCSRAPATRWRRRANRPCPRPAGRGSGPGAATRVAKEGGPGLARVQPGWQVVRQLALRDASHRKRRIRDLVWPIIVP